jgi:hypothetical protein
MQSKSVKFSMLILFLLVSFFSGAQVKPVAKKTTSNNYNITTDDTDGKSKQNVRTFQDGKTYELELVNGKLTELYVDHEKIPAEKYDQYAAVIKRIKDQVKKDMIQAKKTRSRQGATSCRQKKMRNRL